MLVMLPVHRTNQWHMKVEEEQKLSSTTSLTEGELHVVS